MLLLKERLGAQFLKVSTAITIIPNSVGAQSRRETVETRPLSGCFLISEDVERFGMVCKAVTCEEDPSRKLHTTDTLEVSDPSRERLQRFLQGFLRKF